MPSRIRRVGYKYHPSFIVEKYGTAKRGGRGALHKENRLNNCWLAGLNFKGKSVRGLP